MGADGAGSQAAADVREQGCQAATEVRELG